MECNALSRYCKRCATASRSFSNNNGSYVDLRERTVQTTLAQYVACTGEQDAQQDSQQLETTPMSKIRDGEDERDGG